MKVHLPMYSKHILRDKPTLLYHYTKPDGLIGIATTRRIWATEIRYLNDSNEFEHALEIFGKIITEYYEGSARLIKRVKQIDKMFINALQRTVWNNWDHQVYVTSFTEVGDLLSQWRGYCPNGGYAIGFEFGILKKVSSQNDAELWPCIYDDKTKRQLIIETLVFHHRFLQRLRSRESKYDSVELVKIVAQRFAFRLFSIAPILKDKSFSEEREWRIISSRLRIHPEIIYRATPSKIVPYINLFLCTGTQPLSIREVICGPNSNHEHAKKAIIGLLKESRIPDHKIKLSTTPYRGA
jgi:hypothetical protein